MTETILYLGLGACIVEMVFACLASSGLLAAIQERLGGRSKVAAIHLAFGLATVLIGDSIGADRNTRTILVGMYMLSALVLLSRQRKLETPDQE